MRRFRLAVPEDLPGLVTVEASPGTSRWLGDTGTAWHEAVLADTDAEHLVCVENDVVLGFVVLADLRRQRDGVELRRIVVDAVVRGTGVGADLLRFATDRAFGHHGARSVWLDVKADNTRAQQVYARAGFGRVRVDHGALTEPDGTLVDLVIMALPRHVTPTETGPRGGASR